MERRIGIPASTTMYELLREAERFHDRRGRFPDDLAHVLALGGDIHPGSQVAFAGPVGDGFCVIVGISEGRDEPGEPVYTGITRPNRRGVAIYPRSVESCDVLE